VDDIGFAFMDELEHFFQVYKDLEEGKVETGGFTGVDEARRFIREARERAVQAG
jgi:inorganic pyrophosphatase